LRDRTGDRLLKAVLQKPECPNGATPLVGAHAEDPLAILAENQDLCVIETRYVEGFGLGVFEPDRPRPGGIKLDL
jgi:hypothetical protein